ncbi:hypothetical protein COK05_11460 [Bacillus cereus]|uniref:YwbE family protein n=1 Tax=Bacillus cereus TaxID=1396 RepID=A0A2B2LPM9_BACCE|nr:YwbE family protein [Bacillus cereus]PFQ46757.1 hypothetical protein COK05_11460 [Bacillus cereus]
MLKKVLFSVLMGLCVIALSACKGEEEKVKVTTDEQKIEEDKKSAEEEKRKQEEQQRAEEEKRKQEEQQRAEEEKRKQEEQRKQEQQKAQQQQSVQKQENTKQTTGGKPTRSQISVGSHVVIQLDNDYSKTVSGVVKDILTNTETHTYGIKVRLQNGQIGRVQSVG